MVVPVLITSCQVSLKPNNGPLINQMRQRCQHERERMAGRMRRTFGKA